MKTAEEILMENNILIKEKWNNGAPFPFPLNLTRDMNIKVTKDIVRCMEEYGKLMYNQAIDDAITYGQVRCTTNVSSVTASVYGTVAGESFTVDEQTLQKLKKQ